MLNIPQGQGYDEHVALRRGGSALVVAVQGDQLIHWFGRIGHALVLTHPAGRFLRTLHVSESRPTELYDVIELRKRP